MINPLRVSVCQNSRGRRVARGIPIIGKKKESKKVGWKNWRMNGLTHLEPDYSEFVEVDPTGRYGRVRPLSLSLSLSLSCYLL
jgi:hypothetical protein